MNQTTYADDTITREERIRLECLAIAADDSGRQSPAAVVNRAATYEQYVRGQ